MIGEKLTRLVLFAGAVFCVGVSARADDPQPDYRSYLNIYNRPSLSPYLALVPQANNGIITGPAPGTYQTYVKPQVDLNDYRFRQSITAQNQPYVPSPLGPGYQTKNLQTTGFSANVRATGHSSTYMNLSHYYPYASGRPHR